MARKSTNKENTEITKEEKEPVEIQVNGQSPETSESPPADFLADVANDMPNVSTVADSIAEKELQNAKENIPSENGASPQEKRKRGRPPGSKSAPKNYSDTSRLGGIHDPGQRAVSAEDASRLAAASLTVHMLETAGTALAGPAGQMQEAQKQGMVAAYDLWFKKMGVADIPPGIAVVLITSQYAGQCFVAEPARPKVAKAVGWFSSKIRNFKNARSLRRNDGKRENNTGKETNSEIQK